MSYYNEGQAPQQPVYQERRYETKTFGGRLTKDPILRQTQNGNLVTSVDVAMDKMNGDTVFASITYWGNDARLACDFLTKGSQVAGAGRFYFEEYEGKNYLKAEGLTLNLSAKDIESLIVRIIDSKLAKLQQPQEQPQAQAQVQQPQSPAQPQPQAVEEEPVLDISSSDLPF